MLNTLNQSPIKSTNLESVKAILKTTLGNRLKLENGLISIDLQMVMMKHKYSVGTKLMLRLAMNQRVVLELEDLLKFTLI